ncbi:MAG: hypothetical protein WCP21_17160, partial [Armatimonadota bacterium]
MTMILRWLPAILILSAVAAQAQPRLALMSGAESNAFGQAARDLGLALDASASPSPDHYAALLLCAPQYPQVLPLPPTQQQAMESFLAAGKSVYVEYAPLASILGEAPQTAVFERLCLPSADPLRTGLPALSIFEEHSSQHLPLLAAGGQALLNYGRVAGTDRAVYGPDAGAFPALVALPRGNGRLLLATTALSNWRRGRYRPTRSWEALLRAVLLALLPPEEAQAARAAFVDLQAWSEPREWVAPDQKVRLCLTARPGTRVTVTGPGGEQRLTVAEGGRVETPALSLPKGAHEWRVQVDGAPPAPVIVKIAVGDRRERYRQTVARNLAWYERAKMLVAPEGSAGVREGFTNHVGPEGKPEVAGCPRVDCISESALLFAVYGRVCANQK